MLVDKVDYRLWLALDESKSRFRSPRKILIANRCWTTIRLIVDHIGLVSDETECRSV